MWRRNHWYVYLVPGVVLLLLGMLLAVRKLQFRRTAQRGQGKVIANHHSPDSDGSGTYHAEVEFQTADGQTHRFVSGTDSSHASFEVGEQVPILFDPASPETGRIDTFSEQFSGPLLVSGFGMFFALLGGIPLYLRIKRGKLADWLKTNGRAIQADFTAVRMRTDYEVIGRNPYQLSARWLNPATHKIHVFESDNLWFDPTPYVTSKTLTVLIDPDRPQR